MSTMTYEIKNIEDVLLPKYLTHNEEIINCHTKRLTAPGENYGSLMLATDIQIRNKETKEEHTVHAVGKTVPRNEFIQKVFKSPITFDRELRFYKTVIPTLQEFQKENGIEDVMDFFPEFYGGRLGMNPDSDKFDDNAVVLLENLKVKGYYSVDRTKGFDLDTAKYILKDLAIFHAVPIALKLKKPEVFQNKILPNIQRLDVFSAMGDDTLFSMIDSLVGVAKENEECLPAIPTMKEKLLESVYFTKQPSQPREPFCTMVHTDFWVNNTMIKTDEGKIVGNKIVDFQMPEYGTPARDLMFFIFDSIQNDLVEKYYDNLVEFYHKNFIRVLQQFDVNTEPFSLEEFKKEIDLAMQETARFQCFIMLNPIFATSEGLKDIENMKESDMAKNDFISDLFKEKLWMLVKEFLKRKWL